MSDCYDRASFQHRDSADTKIRDRVAERRTKGAMDAFCARTFDLNRERLKPFLLDGLIAGAGLLDRAAIETYLTRPFANRDQLFYQLLPIIDAELWARALVAGSR